MKLSVIIVNYNVKYFLEQALLSVRKAMQEIEAEVFVVDNNSVDDSVDMVKEKFPEVILIANQDNPGFSKANNQAIAQAKGEYILLLNPDTVVEEDTFEKCIAFMDVRPDGGGLGVKMIDGSGKFLPESKRGFPSPWVAFSKTFGLSRLFPKSKLFNQYHLGYLDKDENHEIDVLSGAFMFMRKSVLDQVGYLDEDFFMYGEDIDLSYRIQQAGYKNYYLADTKIIHYKGESTKKGSLNYVKTFYNAMIIFARKHFSGEKASLFILGIHFAIYLRAILTLFSNFFKRAALPFLDATIIFVGFYFLKDFWATYHFKNPDYYPASFLYFNVPLYIAIWLSSVFFSGGYDEPYDLKRLIRGLLFGTLILAAVYGFLDLQYRPSRALIILGLLWAILSISGQRILMHFTQFKNFKLGEKQRHNLIIVGSFEETKRVKELLFQAEVQKNIIGIVSPDKEFNHHEFLSGIAQLDEVVHIYKIHEIIFCSKNVPTQSILNWMTKLGPEVEYKIVPDESLSIIGSSSKNAAGELYSIDIQFRITQPINRRNKRVLDLALSLGFLLTLPVTIWFVDQKSTFVRNIFDVMAGRLSWVGYAKATKKEKMRSLPKIRKGVLSPLDALHLKTINTPTIMRLNFLYAKDYQAERDLEIIWKGFRKLGS